MLVSAKRRGKGWIREEDGGMGKEGGEGRGGRRDKIAFSHADEKGSTHARRH